jgi:hypothetical protein
LQLLTLIAQLIAPLAYQEYKITEWIITTFKEIQKNDGEALVFKNLVRSLLHPMEHIHTRWKASIEEYHLFWDYRTFVLGMINAMISCNKSISVRNHIRGEFEAVHLKSILRNLSFQSPPAEFILQMNTFHDERLKDVSESSTQVHVEMGDCFGLLYVLFENVKKMKSKSAKDSIISVICILHDIINDALKKDQNEPMSTQLNLMLALVEKTTNSLLQSIKSTNSINTEFENQWISDFVESTFEIIGVPEYLSRETISESKLLEKIKQLQAKIQMLEDRHQKTLAQVSNVSKGHSLPSEPTLIQFPPTTPAPPTAPTPPTPLKRDHSLDLIIKSSKPIKVEYDLI